MNKDEKKTADRLDTLLMGMSFRDEPPQAEANLKDDLGIDSLRLVELIVAVEEEYGIVIDESDLDPAALDTVADLRKVVRRYAA